MEHLPSNWSPEKYEFVRLDHHPNYMEKIKARFQTNNQPLMYDNVSMPQLLFPQLDFQRVTSGELAAQGTVWGLQEVGPRAMQHASQALIPQNPMNCHLFPQYLWPLVGFFSAKVKRPFGSYTIPDQP